MTEQQHTDGPSALTTTQVREAGLEDWRQILGALKARYRTGDFATGMALVTAIGEAAVKAGHTADLTLTPADLVVGLSTRHGTRQGITSLDLDLARLVSARAAHLGVRADPSGLTQVEPGLDTPHGERLAPYYAALLGSEVVHGEPVDRSGQVPTVWWQEPSDEQDGSQLPDRDLEQRWHLDVWVAHDEAERRLQAVLAAGGRLISDAQAPSYWVVEDEDGNRSCLCTPSGR